jgi:hypothetical protein
LEGSDDIQRRRYERDSLNSLFMADKKSIVIAGRMFATQAEAARHYGVGVMTLSRRLRSGYTPEQAVGLEPRRIRRDTRKSNVRVETSRGVFPSVQVAAEVAGLDPGTVHARLRDGWAPDEALGFTPHKRRPKTTTPVEFAGVTYPNLEASALAHGLAGQLVGKRVRSGWTLAQALEKEEAPPRFRNQSGGARTRAWKSVEIVDGKEYPGAEPGAFKLYLITNSANGKQYVGITITSLADRLRGHRACAMRGYKSPLYNAMRHYGPENFGIELIRNDASSFAALQRQEIAEITKRRSTEIGYNVSPGGSVGTPDPITVGGVVFPSRAAAALHYGIDPRVFNLRIGRLKWTPEQAAEIAPRERYARHHIVVGNESFPSFKAAAARFGIDYKTAYKRYSEGRWTAAQALGQEPPPAGAKYAGVAIEAFGQRFASIAECARAFGVEPGSLLNRVKKLGTPVEAAIEILRSGGRRR